MLFPLPHIDASIGTISMKFTRGSSSLPNPLREGWLLPYSTGQRAPACFYTPYVVYLVAAATPSYPPPAPRPHSPGSTISIALSVHATRAVGAWITKNQVFSLWFHTGACLARAPTEKFWSRSFRGVIVSVW